MRMDDLDELIIAELIDDGRKPFRQIAEKIGVSTPTVIKRYNELKRKEIIQCSCIQLDLVKLGYKGTAHLLITSSGASKLSEVMEQIQEINGIIIASRAMGDFEGYAVLAFRDIEDLYDKVLQIKNLPNVYGIEMSIGVPGLRYFPPKRNPFATITEKHQSK